MALRLPRPCRPIDMAHQAVTLADLTTDFEHCAEIFEQYGCFVVDDAIETPEMLDELDDVQNVHSNADIDEAVLAEAM